MQDIRVGGKYKILKKIGSGSFGEIFEGVNLENNESIAIKLEKVNTRYPQLIYESKLIKLIQGGVGIPAVHWSGSEGAITKKSKLNSNHHVHITSWYSTF